MARSKLTQQQQTLVLEKHADGWGPKRIATFMGSRGMFTESGRAPTRDDVRNFIRAQQPAEEPPPVSTPPEAAQPPPADDGDIGDGAREDSQEPPPETVEAEPVTDLIRLPDHEPVRTLVDNAELKKNVATSDFLPGEFTRLDIGDGVELDS